MGKNRGQKVQILARFLGHFIDDIRFFKSLLEVLIAGQ